MTYLKTPAPFFLIFLIRIKFFSEKMIKVKAEIDDKRIKEGKIAKHPSPDKKIKSGKDILTFRAVSSLRSRAFFCLKRSHPPCISLMTYSAGNLCYSRAVTTALFPEREAVTPKIYQR